MSSRFHLELGYLVVSIWKAKFSICFTVTGVNVRVNLGFPNVFNEYVRKTIATVIWILFFFRNLLLIVKLVNLWTLKRFVISCQAPSQYFRTMEFFTNQQVNATLISIQPALLYTLEMERSI